MAAGPGQPTLENISDYASESKQILIEQFRRSSFLLQTMPFEASIAPRVGQNLLSTSYQRIATHRGAQFRDWYEDYVPQKASVDTVTAFLKPFGGAHEIDRVFADADAIKADEEGFASYIDFQNSELAKAGAQKFHDAAINGDTAIDPLSFDGLSKILTGTDSEVSGATLNLYEPGVDRVNYWTALRALQRYVGRVRQLGLSPQIWTNEDGIAMLGSIAAQLNYRSPGKDAFGEEYDTFAGAPLVDLGVRPGTDGDAVVPTTPTGVTDLYVVGIGLNGVSAVTLTGDSGFKTYSNLFSTDPGVTKRLEIEMVAAILSKQTRGAFVLRDVKVAPAA